MQLASIVWSKIYYWFLLGCCAALGLASLIVTIVPAWSSFQVSLGLSSSLMILAAIQVAYSFSGHLIIRPRNWQLANFISSLLFSLVALDGLSSTNGHVGNWLYVGIWLISSLFTGIYGLSILIGSAFLMVLYILLEYKFKITHLDAQSIVLLAGSVLTASISYQFWKRVLVSSRTRELNLLSGMLQTKQEQAEIIIQSIADGVIVFDTTGKINLINPAAAGLLEWSVKDALGIDIHSVVKLAKPDGKPLPADNDPFGVALFKKIATAQTIMLISKNNKSTIVSLVISPILLPAQSKVAGAVAVLRDVTREHQEEQQRAEFISTASHEMRTPVAAIEGYLALALNDKVSAIDNKAREYLEKAHESTQHLGKLFQDLLTSAKAEDGRLSNHPSVVEISNFLGQLVEALKFAAQTKNLAVEFLMGSSDVIDTTVEGGSSRVVQPLYYVYVDPDRLREVITNLFDNAVKYTDQGKISIGLTGNNNVVQVYVRDTGPGIPAEDIPHLFQKFYRVDNSATRTVGGTGLGLFICRKIIELYNGRIWVESKLSGGSTFFIDIPRLTADKAEELKRADSSDGSLPPIASLASP